MPTEEEENLYEDHFLYEERKSNKQDRKTAKAKDRSKYKKTDQKMLEKKQPPKELKNLLRGRVLSIMSQGMLVDSGDKLFTCALKGALKKDQGLQKNLVTVGDFVLFEEMNHQEGLIAYVEERYSVLSRADNLLRRKEQLIAANIDQVLITISLVHPPLKTFIVDRYIIAAEKGGMKPIIVVNKIDLLEDASFSEELME